jgi:hypothetical protein
VLDLSDGSLARVTPNDAMITKYSFATWICDFRPQTSPAQEYSLSIDLIQEEMTVFLVNNQTGEWQILTDPTDGIQDGDAVFSPGSKYFIVLQSKNRDILYSSIPRTGDQISIYDFLRRSVVMTFQDTEINSLMFLGDNQKFIYMRGWDTPCVVDILLQTKKCIHMIPDRFPHELIELSGLTADYTRLIFYHYSSTTGYPGGLCFYNLQTGDLNCPADRLAILKDRAVTEYILSPDEKYFTFTYEDSCPSCDSAGLHSGLAVIGRDGKNFYDLGVSNSPHWGGIYLVATWRPISTGKVNP